MNAAGPFFLRVWRRHSTRAKVVLGLGCLLALLQTTRAALFTGAGNPVHSVVPYNEFHQHHSCFTAYYEAARLAGTLPNLYDDAAYRRAVHDSLPPWQQSGDRRRTLHGFFVDQYEYPPPFLLLPRVFIALGVDFLQARALWFVLQTALVVAALLLLAWHLGDEWGGRFTLLAPFIYVSPPVQTSIQIGNFQVGAFALAVIAFVAMARGRHLLGAALLSFVILAKLFPGALLLVLAARRQWRPLLLTLACLALWIGLAVLVFGWAPFEAFWRYHLPRIQSGEAFPQMRFPLAIAVNQSVYGIPLKLSLFGIGAGSARVASLLASLYTVVPCLAALLLARKTPEPILWTLVVALGTYRSPFLPQEYAAIGPLLVLSLLASARPFDARRAFVFITAFVLLVLQVPFGLIADARTVALVNTVPQLAAIAVFVAAFRTRS
jgi:hypothetical protein